VFVASHVSDVQIGAVESRVACVLYGARNRLPSWPVNSKLPFDHQSDVHHPYLCPSLCSKNGKPRPSLPSAEQVGSGDISRTPGLSVLEKTGHRVIHQPLASTEP
jgi:hypothetical protein